ncbi:MAG: hypothetical protein K9G71_17195 [Rhodobacteraceae bacterium]|nr:hypothetical protein [Paracoccaceae bacterium]MCF8516180.1 hypothetical protein [Paracoccaceae bacterium]MCF8520452.1 hypothetical protein [Paracoccaceae bacterium]
MLFKLPGQIATVFSIAATVLTLGLTPAPASGEGKTLTVRFYDDPAGLY